MLTRVTSFVVQNFSKVPRQCFSPSILNSAASLRTSQKHFIKNFHYSSLKCAPSNQELVNALDSEIKAEKKLEEDNLGGSSAPTIPGFSIKANDAEITLTKTFGSEKIYVTFNVNHSVVIEKSENTGEDETEDSDHSDLSVPVSLPPFSVEVVKGDERLCFELNLVQREDLSYDFDVDEFFVAKGSHEKDIEESVYAASGEYIDPTLHDLLFVNYLEERGFTTGFCQSLANFATHYEHSQYVTLLKKIKEFVSK